MTSVALHSHHSTGMGHDRRSWGLVHSVRQGLKLTPQILQTNGNEDEEVSHVTV